MTPAATLPINPPGSLLGAENAVLAGTARGRYYVADFEGCLSIKTVVRGCGAWEAGNRRFPVNSGSYLILNDRQRYTLTIDTPHRTSSTFCVFFERGFVEDVARATVTASAALLDAPATAARSSVVFIEKLETRDDGLAAALV